MALVVCLQWAVHCSSQCQAWGATDSGKIHLCRRTIGRGALTWRVWLRLETRPCRPKDSFVLHARTRMTLGNAARIENLQRDIIIHDRCPRISGAPSMVHRHLEVEKATPRKMKKALQRYRAVLRRKKGSEALAGPLCSACRRSTLVAIAIWTRAYPCELHVPRFRDYCSDMGSLPAPALPRLLLDPDSLGKVEWALDNEKDSWHWCSANERAASADRGAGGQ